MALTIGIVGSGYIARYHARAVVNAGDNLGWIISRTRESAQRLVTDVPEIPDPAAVRVSPALDDILSDKTIDAVILAQPNYLHAPHAIACLEAGKHVLVEKPIALSRAEADEMLRTVRRTHRVLMTGHMWRHDPEVIWLRREIAAGTIGGVVRTEGYGVHERWGPEGWFLDPARSGGGALVDMGVHAVDTARFLLGDPRPVSVFARIRTAFGSYAVDDDAHVVVEWDNDSYSVIHAGWWQPKAPGPEAATRLWGTAGYASLFPSLVEVPGAGGAASGGTTSEGEWVRRTPPASLPARKEHCDQTIYDAQYRAFVQQIGTGTGAAFPEAGYVALAVVQAAYESSSSRRPVSFTW